MIQSNSPLIDVLPAVPAVPGTMATRVPGFGLAVAVSALVSLGTVYRLLGRRGA
jgi:hypothetical protein